ncbi:MULTISPECIES: CsbD family protein [unclassified Streptomyces]|uniref:CsbD family protein n=1 Tax=unclassified Streptomyces TaxID=2593676 RepID=UPI0004C3F529
MAKGDMQKGKGKIKDAVGKATGNRRMEAEGKGDRAQGAGREAVEKVRNMAEKARGARKRGTS